MAWQDLRAEVAAEFASLPRFRIEPGFTLTKDTHRHDPAEYRRRVAAGICALCSKPAEPGRVKCAAHRSVGEVGRYARWVSEGRCGTCGGVPQDGHTRCSSCLKADRLRARAKRARRRA